MEGTAVFRGTRMPVQALLDYPEAGGTIDDLLTMAKRSNVLRARRSILVAITTSSTVRAGWPARPLPSRGASSCNLPCETAQAAHRASADRC
jgi:hypothetical protein